MTNRLLLQFLSLMILPFSSIANPWLPEAGGWKYNLSYSKYVTPRTIKFYERDLYFELEKKKALANNDLSKQRNIFNQTIDKRKQYLLTLNATMLDNLSASLTAQGVYIQTRLQQIQEAKNTLFANDQDLQIYYKNLNNITTDLQNQLKQIDNLQKYLVLSYYEWSAKTAIEYGLNDHISYGMSIGRTNGVNKYKTNHITDEAEIFVKTKLYDKNGYIFTIQPKIVSGPLDGLDVTAMLGKSHALERKLFDRPIEVFGYTAVGITYFLGNQPMLRRKIHAEITSGIKYNDSTILMNQESEDFNPLLGKMYRRVLRSQFTVAQDLNFANIEPRNKVYLTFSYFSINSVKTRRHLSSGYSIGLWLEL